MMITAKHPVRAAVAGLDNYFDYKNDAVQAVYAACAKHGVELVSNVCDDYSKDEGRILLPLRPACDARVVCECCKAESDSKFYDNFVVFAWYTMPSGRIELTAYVS